MARSFHDLSQATDVIPSPNTGWTHRFLVTAYEPTTKYRTSDKTATGIKAEPGRHIVAVDPTLIPLHSNVWIEGKGWYIAEDTGSLIKGFHLDMLVWTTEEAERWGRQEKLVIVVPPIQTVSKR
jgi:3D (Asp-Asp-Asp) domain-containing protein